MWPWRRGLSPLVAVAVGKSGKNQGRCQRCQRREKWSSKKKCKDLSTAHSDTLQLSDAYKGKKIKAFLSTLMT